MAVSKSDRPPRDHFPATAVLSVKISGVVPQALMHERKLPTLLFTNEALTHRAAQMNQQRMTKKDFFSAGRNERGVMCPILLTLLLNSYLYSSLFHSVQFYCASVLLGFVCSHIYPSNTAIRLRLW